MTANTFEVLNHISYGFLFLFLFFPIIKVIVEIIAGVKITNNIKAIISLVRPWALALIGRIINVINNDNVFLILCITL